MTKIKAIETRYAGCRFRSRLEARWAVFFDNMEIEWQYEPEGFELPSGRYLPDFFLPQSCSGTWIEVKGSAPSQREIRCAVELTHTLAAGGRPWTYRMLVGDVPRSPLVAMGGMPSVPNLKAWPEYILARPSVIDGEQVGAELHRSGALSLDGPTVALTPVECWSLQQNLWGFLPNLLPLVTSSLSAARSARFEHGESGGRPAAARPWPPNGETFDFSKARQQISL